MTDHDDLIREFEYERQDRWAVTPDNAVERARARAVVIHRGRPQDRYDLRVSHTPPTATIMPTRATGVRVSPKMAQARSAVVGGTR